MTRIARRAESEVAAIGRLGREALDMRTTMLGRMVPRARLDFPVFVGRPNSNQSLSSGGFVAISLNATATIDTHGGHSSTANPTRYTCPTGWPGIYQVSGQVFIDTTLSAQIVSGSIGLNGTNLGYAQTNSYGGDEFSAVAATTFVEMEEGDYVELLGAQFSGSSRSTLASLCAMSVMFCRRA